MSAASLFNAYVTTAAVSASFEIGLLDEVARHGKLDGDQFAADRGLYPPAVHAVVTTLADAGVLRVVETGPVVLAGGPAFDDVWTNKGYFLWLVGGYGEMLSRMARLTTEATRAATDPGHRDGGAIARAGKDYGRHFVDPIVDRLFGEHDFAFLADLGCGSANRIIRLATTYPDRRFLGIERDSGAIAVACRAVADAGLADRITIIEGDLQRLADRPEFAEVDTLMSFFLGHDFWPRDACLRTLDGIRQAFPNAGTFLLSDTYASPRQSTGDKPIFTLGFEVTHALMGQYVPTAAEWCALFEESSWRLTGRTTLDIAYSEVFHLAPAPSGR
ncbi:methyltransferase domain-containing protein [Actinoplanes sp. TFC3]|uniref:methyltransferase domain-containing protein n=1 Tax=Actinoplanes sp. TFC3 TaxID=1710355 RepID=UPI00083703D1|nr:methyltransferase domain-containing protein [Actinoplanes sp. TFC3]